MKTFDSVQTNQARTVIRPNVQVLHKPIPPGNKPPKKSRFLKWLLIFVIIGIIILGGGAVLRAMNLSSKIFVDGKWTFWDIPKNLFNEDQKLIGEDSGQINILLLGVGGEEHDGPFLTDTMIVAQIRPKTGTVSLVSIPRDYEVVLPDNLGAQKVNAAFAYGLGKEKNDFATAGAWARQEVEKISGLTIPYFAVLDFKGFEKAINEVSGIEVNVENSFTDAEYPNSSFGYLPPQTFNKGLQHMDGKTALIFARSRHGNNNEGSDFARSKRQKKIIEAFKDKALNLNLISDSSTINKLLGVFADHFHTNISPFEILHLYKLSKDGKMASIVSSSLDPQTKLVCDGKNEITGAYIVFPCPGVTGTDLNNFFKNSFTAGQLSEERPLVWLGNSTDNPKLYQNAEKILSEAGIIVLQVGFSKDFLNQTVVYMVNQKPATLEFVKNNLNAVQALTPPKGIKIDPSKVDIIVILGNGK